VKKKMKMEGESLHLAEKKRQNHASISSSSSRRLYCFLVRCEIKVKYMMSITCFQLCFALLGPAPTGTGTIKLDPTFGSFTLLESISH